MLGGTATARSCDETNAPEPEPGLSDRRRRDGDEAIVRAHGHVANQSDAERGERGLDHQQGGDGEQRMPM